MIYKKRLKQSAEWKRALYDDDDDDEDDHDDNPLSPSGFLTLNFVKPKQTLS